jgi:hypothetical protein
MKKYLLGILGVILTTVIIIGLKYYISSSQENTSYASAAALYGSNTGLTIPTEEGDKGTVTNPFVILEIVPYEGYAEIGYMIQGCEPIPMDQLSFDRDGGTLVASTSGMKCEWKEEYTFDLPEGDKVGTSPENWQEVAEKGKQYGYYEKVEEGKGSFYQVQVVVSTVEDITYLAATEEKEGNYNWIPYLDNKPTDLTDKMSVSEELAAEKVHTSRERIQYRRYRNFFTYENKFLTEVLKVPSDKINEYKIMVITITPQKLNLSINQPWIDRADLISFSPKSHYDNALVSLWEKYHDDMAIKYPLTKPTSFGFNGSDKTTCNDLTWEATVEILRKASVDVDKAPIIFDARVFTEDNSFSWNSGSKPNNVTPNKYYSGGDTVNKNTPSSNPNYLDISSQGYFNNIAKLYLVMQQMDPAKFYHEYIDTNLIKSVTVVTNNKGTKLLKNGTVTITTGYYKDLGSSSVTKYNIKKSSADDAAAVWSIYTFLPYHFFENKKAVETNEVWKTIGIDNYNVINQSSPQISVHHNLYSYNGDKSLTQDIINLNKVPFDTLHTVDAFYYYGKTSGAISPAMSIYYLLYGQPVYNQETLHILEIEPCKDFIWDGTAEEWSVGSITNGSDYARQFYTKFFPNFDGKIAIKTITTAEYIGNIDDINAVYDMIIFGLRDGMLKKNSSGATIYNDGDTLKNKIYIHNGDSILQSNYKLRGLAGTSNPLDTYRFSGNDITQLKLEELKNFMEAGNPIILDTGFFTNSSRTNINTSKIDSNSNIYRLANLTNTYEQLFYAEGISTNSLENLLSVSNCKIVFGKNDESLLAENCYPVVYHDRTKDKYKGYADAQIYINGNNPQYRTLQYKFYIKDDNSSNTTYTVKLYIDINADGKFDDLTENVSSLNLVTEFGYAEDYDALEPGVNYTLTRTLEADYYGVLPWKLEIISNNNDQVRDSIINYCALKSTSKIKLNILQVLSNTNNNVKLTDEPFKTLIQNVNDFNISVTTWTVDQLNAKCKTDSNPYTYLLSDDNDNFGVTDGSNGIDDDRDEQYDFDMIILGFADMYSDIGYRNTLQNIEDFIEEGKSVLFTHDTTSFINNPASIYKDTYHYSDFWGYGLNKKFRNILGMDRFGVTLDAANREAAGKDFASDNADYTGYIQGYSNMILNRYANTSKIGSHKNITLSNIESNFTTNKVTNVNHGQLTMYPYEIDDNFNVATTHAQYYQLDMEDDDIVVWYCLSDGNSSGNGVYSTTPNDVRNNYYIYNIGNITYSGVGHSAISSTVENNTEAKLFVNTMVAAYTATAKDSEIQITNKNTSVNADGNQYIYVDYDIYDTTLAYGSEVQKVASEQYQRVKFRVIDNNILFNKTLTLSYYIATENNGVVTETPISGIATKKVKTNTEVTKVNSGEEYYIDIPLSKLQDNKMIKENNLGTKISIHVLVTYGKLSDKTKSTKLFFTLARRGLFDLD